MTAQAQERKALPAVAHEVFCLPREGLQEPRVEQFLAYRDEPSGRSLPVATVTRCMECGATTYQPNGA